MERSFEVDSPSALFQRTVGSSRTDFSDEVILQESALEIGRGCGLRSAEAWGVVTLGRAKIRGKGAAAFATKL
jgi:hypothetical protein